MATQKSYWRMKKTDIKTVWQVPRYLPYVQPDLTDEILAAAEKQIGYKLPQEFIDILKIQNGGYIRFIIKDTPHSRISGIGPYFPSLTDCDLTDYKEYVSFELKGLIPFDGDGHWYFCFDYRENKTTPKITYIDTECDNEVIIANSFKVYLDLLELNTDDEYVIETDYTIDEILNKISDLAKIEFQDAGSWANGYQLYRAEYKDSCVWLSQNNVPSGFIRDEDERYNELKLLMDTKALRFPELSEKALLINVPDKTEQLNLFNQLSANGIKIRELNDFV